MNNEAFKRYISPHLEAVITYLGGDERIRELHTQMPDHIIHFVAGGVFGRVAGDDPQLASWREDRGFIRGLLFLNQEEIRRTLDVVRLRLETGSATS